MAQKPESRLQSKIQKELGKAFPGSFFYKTHGNPYQRAGIPDIIGCVNGCFIGVEVKLPGKENTLTELQKDSIKRINKAGGLAFMSTSVEYTVETIKAFFEDGKRP